MKKVYPELFLTILVLVGMGLLSGCATDKNLFALTNTGIEEPLKQIAMCDGQKGWALNAENELLHTTSGIGHFKCVKTFDKMLPASEGEISLCGVDENTAYLAYFSIDGENILIEYTTDGGENWENTAVSYASYGGAYKAYLSFVDREHGYLLYCSDPGAGMMTKILFSTGDGGETFFYVADLTDEVSGYPTGITFSSETEGFIGTTYHGQDAYFYQTKDGGETWQSIELPQYERKDSLYIEGYAPVFFGENQKQGKLLLQYVTADKRNTILYTSGDGGESWTPQQELECDGVRSYDFYSENDGYLIDETGCLLQLKASAGTARQN